MRSSMRTIIWSTSVFALLALFTALPVHATSRARRSEETVCAMAEWVFVGTVSKMEPIRTNADSQKPDAMLVSIEPDIVVHGSAQTSFSFLLGIGWQNGKMVFSGDDVPAEGQRYVIAARRALARGPFGAASLTVDVLMWRKLASQSVLPSAGLAKLIWREHCAKDFDAEREGRPTAPFAQFMDAELGSLCIHY